MDIKEIDSYKLDVLREIGNIGSGNAATSLAKLLNMKVDMKVPEVKIVEFKNVSDILGGAEKRVVGLMLRVEGDITGGIMFILGYREARVLVNQLMGVDTSNIRDGFNEMESSALLEIGNILASSYISALSTLTDLKIKASVPDMAVDMAGAILSVPAIEFGKVGDNVLFIQTVFLEGTTSVSGSFFLIPDLDSYGDLLKALGVSI